MLPPKEHLRSAIYVRVSTKLQEDRYSLSGQIEELTRYANAQGWEIVETFKDVESGAKFDKEGLESLLDCIEDGKVDVVLVIEQDRLSRLDTVDWEILKDVLRENGVKIAEPGSIIDLTNDDDEFISDIKNLLARRERRSIKRKMNRGMRQYTREGKVAGRIPDEYLYNKLMQKPVINEERAWIIPFIDRLYLEEGYGTYRIANELNKLCTTGSGAKWTDVQVKTRLVNKAYHGVLTRKFLNGETVIVEDAFPALRTRDTYEKIQLRLKSLKKQPQESSTTHALRRLKMTCAHCGRALSLSVLKKEKYNKVYVMVLHNKEYAKPCPVNPSFNALQLIRPMFELVKNILLDKNNAQQYFDSNQKSESNLKELETESKLLHSRIQSNNEKLDRLLDLYLEGRWDKAKLDENKELIEKENAENQLRIVQIDQKLELIRQEKYNLDAFFEVVGNVGEYLAIFQSMEERNELLPSELDESDREKLISKMFDHAVIDTVKGEALLYGKSIEEVPVEFVIEIDRDNVVLNEEQRMKRFERYQNTQGIIDQQEIKIDFMELSRLSGHKPETLNRDAEEFGPYRGLNYKKGSPERRAYTVQVVKDCLAKDINARTKDIAKIAQCSSLTVQKIIRELKLRPTRK